MTDIDNSVATMLVAIMTRRRNIPKEVSAAITPADKEFFTPDFVILSVFTRSVAVQ